MARGLCKSCRPEDPVAEAVDEAVRVRSYAVGTEFFAEFGFPGILLGMRSVVPSYLANRFVWIAG